MQRVCWGTSIMDGVILCTMGNERLNTHMYILYTVSQLLNLFIKSKYFVSV